MKDLFLIRPLLPDTYSQTLMVRWVPHSKDGVYDAEIISVRPLLVSTSQKLKKINNGNTSAVLVINRKPVALSASQPCKKYLFFLYHAKKKNAFGP